MSGLGLGGIIGDDRQRDAVHMAIAPVVAGEILQPGQHVALTGDSTDRVESTGGKIGVIDPFLTSPVAKGQRCWLFLYPGTITSLRHDWTHPAFGREEDSPKAASRAWIESFAGELDQTYSRLMDAAEEWERDEEYTYDNSEQYKRVDYSKWAIFWGHYEVMTGRTAKEKGSFFTCSC